MIETCYKELAHIEVRQVQTQESRWCYFQSEFKSENRGGLMSQLKDSQAEKEFFVIHLFILFKPWNDWMSPTHNGEDNLLYSVY